MTRTAAAAAVLGLVAAGCSGPAPAPGSTQREAAVQGCPVPSVPDVPADLPASDRETVNLGGGLLGHRLTFQRTTARRVVASVGADPLDALEDLDMEAHDAVLGGRPVTVSTTGLQPGLVVVEIDAALPPRCGGFALLTERLTAAELSSVVRTATVTDVPS